LTNVGITVEYWSKKRLRRNAYADENYDTTTRTVEIRISSNQAKNTFVLNNIATILHELIHADTDRIINTDDSELNEEEKQIKKDFLEFEEAGKDAYHNVFAKHYLNKLAESLKEYHQRPENRTELDKDIADMKGENRDPELFSAYFPNNKPDDLFYTTLAWIGMENDGDGKHSEDVVDEYKNLSDNEVRTFEIYINYAERIRNAE